MRTVQDSMGLLNYFTECGYIARPYRPPFTAGPCVAFELSDAGDLFHMGLDCAAIADTGPEDLGAVVAAHGPTFQQSGAMALAVFDAFPWPVEFPFEDD